MYVNLTRNDWPDIEGRIDEIATAPGVVFDMRGYPGDVRRILDHLLRAPEDAEWMQVPRIVEPDGRVIGWHSLGWHRRPATPTIEGSVVFLISAEAISYAESILGYVEAHDLGTLVGSPTAGANGDIVRLDTLGGFYVVFTGMRVTLHDGSPLHVRGIEPDVSIHPTLDDVQAGRDVVLEAGLRVVRRTISEGVVAGERVQ
jgi:hypothetical protein